MKFKVFSSEGYVVEAEIRLSAIQAVVPVLAKGAPDCSRVVLAGAEFIVERDPLELARLMYDIEAGEGSSDGEEAGAKGKGKRG